MIIQKFLIPIFYCLFILNFAFAQISPDSLFNQKNLINPPAVDVDFLFHYYDQDGEHSAVTGGEGTEKLRDYSSKIIINVLLDSVTKLNLNTGINHYTSASTDRIDHVSSASRADTRAQIEASYSKKVISKSMEYNFNAGGSVESDYISASFGTRFSVFSKDENRELQVGAKSFFDTWQLFFPNELRDSAHLTILTDKRRTFDFSFTYNQALSRRWQAAISSNFVFQHGLLSTPFHRVYFKNHTKAGLEVLPKFRVKFPISIRANYFLGNHLILRTFYRFYVDNFSILANSFQIETVFKIGSSVSVFPFYRFYKQSNSAYFQEKGQHEFNALYRTSDYDLSNFHSHKTGIGLRYSPSNLFQKKQRQNSGQRFDFRKIALQFSHYRRSDGLSYFLASIQGGFSF